MRVSTLYLFAHSRWQGGTDKYLAEPGSKPDQLLSWVPCGVYYALTWNAIVYPRLQNPINSSCNTTEQNTSGCR